MSIVIFSNEQKNFFMLTLLSLVYCKRAAANRNKISKKYKNLNLIFRLYKRMENDDLEDLIKCCICFDVYERPVCIECGHVFCLECIIEYQKLTENKELRCPLCKRVFKRRRKHFWKVCIPLNQICSKYRENLAKEQKFNFDFEVDLEKLSEEEIKRIPGIDIN